MFIQRGRGSRARPGYREPSLADKICEMYDFILLSESLILLFINAVTTVKSIYFFDSHFKSNLI
jgi:hypothetical protein